MNFCIRLAWLSGAALFVASADARAVTVLDSSVTPVLITQPGSYALEADINVSSGGGIIISSSGVSLDLRGHTISGAGSCSVASSGMTTSCSGTGVGILVNIQGSVAKHARARIHNGAVRGFSAGLVSVNSGNPTDLLSITVSDFSAYENFVGIGIDDGMGDLARIYASSNAIGGVTCLRSCQIIDSVLAFNGEFGAQLFGGEVRDSVAYRNGNGFVMYDGRILNSQANDNKINPGLTSGHGINALGPVVIEHVVMRGNQGAGFSGSATERSRISDSTSTGNGGPGFSIFPSSASQTATCFSNVTSSGNSGGDAFPSTLSTGLCNVSSVQSTLY